MHDFWNQIVLGNTVKKYFIVSGAILAGIIFKGLISRLIAGLLYRFVKRITSGVDKATFENLVMIPLETFLVILVTLASIEKLHFPEELDFDIYEISSRAIAHSIAISVFIMAFFWVLLRIIDFIALILKWKAHAAGDIKDHQLIVFLRDFLKVIVGLVGILFVLSTAFKFQIGSLWTGLGIAGAALALATKESIENLIASFIIFFDKPFTAGDIVKVNNITGTVERIGLRSTRIRTEYKTFVTVPNKQMVDSIVDNQTLRTQRKAELRLEISLNASTQDIQDLINGSRILLRKDGIEDSSVFLNDIKGNAFLVNIDYFTGPISLTEFNAIKEGINIEILRLMEKLGIEIAGASADIRVSNAGAPPA
jgi:MscS family membrane protein